MMTLVRRLSLFLPLFLVIMLTDLAVPGVVSVDTFNRADFVFGSGTSAYQEDVQLMADTGLEAYRLSISWSRLIPNGKGPVNPKGRKYYNNLINELIGHGNYQLPLKDFVAYADVCFREFGDRVLHWTTFNEANIYTFGGYDEGSTPPRRCSPSCGVNCTKGNSSTEPYIVGHNILLAHASAARLYRKNYKATQHGFVGLNIYAFWFVPYTNAMEDTIATQRANDFYIGWFVNPLVFGDYPDIMKKKAGTRIPAFTKLESKQLKGSYDFLGVNHHITIYIKDKSSNLQMECRDFSADLAAEMICMSVILQPKVNQFLYKILSQRQVINCAQIETLARGVGRRHIMRRRRPSLFLPLFLLVLTELAVVLVLSVDTFSRADFPADFVFGSGTSAYQVEGAAFEDGRTASIWDTFVHDGHMNEGNGDIACDGYHKYKEDVQLMADTGLEAYRFSISCSRLIPSGRGPVNPKGRQYYNSLINELISHGKTSVAYADVCFREFGDRVLHWTTFNEANTFALGGYDLGVTPPGRCSPPFGINCTRGNSSNEPYIVGDNILLAHASAARLYQKKIQGSKRVYGIFRRPYLRAKLCPLSNLESVTQHGFVGLNLFAYWFVPYTNAMEDAIATQRANDYYVGWIVNPLVFGDYPDILKKNAGTRIPAFTKHESKQLKGSFDFLGVNQYNRLYIKDKPCSLEMESRDFSADMVVQLICISTTLQPKSITFLCMWPDLVELTYLDIWFPITPSGQRTQRNGTLNDTSRVQYLHGFIGSLLDAVRYASRLHYYQERIWSFLDVFELLDGYESSFGLYYVDLDDKGLKRYPKLSADWYSNFLKGGSIGPDIITDLLQVCIHAPAREEKRIGVVDDNIETSACENPVLVFGVDAFSRADFPTDFVFGSGTSAYQVEGAAFEDGTTGSIWDTFVDDGRCLSVVAHSMIGLLIVPWAQTKVSGHLHGATGDNSMQRLSQDAADTTLRGLFFLPFFGNVWMIFSPFSDGRGPVNPKGREYYNNFINELINHGIQPHVTLVHDDLPQVLEDEYGRWLGRRSVKDFAAYADVCFREFGDGVLHWSTFNEANIYALGGYDLAITPPGRCSLPFGLNCTIGNSSTEPYIIGHNILLAHASDARWYWKSYKTTQHGFVGLNVYASWFVPYTNSTEDAIATQRANDFYVSLKVRSPSIVPSVPCNTLGFARSLEYFKHVYGNPPLFVHENALTLSLALPLNFSSKINSRGISFMATLKRIEGIINGEDPGSMWSGRVKFEFACQRSQRNGTLSDPPRVEYLHAYIGYLLDAVSFIRDLVGIVLLTTSSADAGLMIYSASLLLDGYESAFGLYCVDLDDKGLKRRYPKLSAH
ncbi:hypothetical protein RJ639_045518, partial [Escallonia herrerae]